MQSTIFLPGCYSSRDLNVCTNGGAWPICNDERTLNSGHSYNIFMPPPNEDQFLAYDKEVLRQTMVKHEYIFRDQVHELHRLYRRQRELMDTIKRRELSKQSLQLQTSQSNYFLPKISSDSAQKTWQIPSLPWVNPAASRLSISSVENFQSTSSISEWKSTGAAPDAAHTEGSLEDRKLLHSKCEKPKKKMLDLELPADEYIDTKEEDQFGEDKVSKVPELPCYSPKRIPEVSQKIDLKLFPCGGPVNSICQTDSYSPDTFSRRTNDLADLNEPIWLEDAVALNAVNFLGSNTFHKGIPCQEHELSGKSNSGYQVFSKEIVSNIQTGRAVESCLNSKHPEKRRQQELLPRNEEAGQRINNLNLAKLEPSSVSSQRKQNSKTVQALPGFNIAVPSSKSTESSQASALLNGNGFHCSRRMRISPGVGSLNPLGNSFCIGSQSESRTEACSPSICFNHLNCSNANGFPSEVYTNCFHRSIGGDGNFAKFMDLNMPPSCLLDSEVSQQNVGTEDGVKMLDYSNKNLEEREDLPPTDLVFSQAFPTPVCYAQPNRFKTCECPGNEKILGSCNFEKPRVSTDQFFALASSPNSHPDASEDKDIKSNLEAGMLDTNLASCPVLNSRKQLPMDDVSVDITVDRKLSRVGNQFDLNCCINEDESSPTLSISRVTIKTVAEMDLEAPVSPENKECSPPRGESEENQLETAIQVSKHEDRDQKDELVRMAAEAIVSISTPGFQKLLLENTDYETLEASPSDSLYWFAGVVSFMASDLENEVGVVLSGEDGGDQQELSSDGSYYFEAMTLELTETKVEEYLCKSKSNSQKEEETGSVLSSPSQPRRGRTRRGRQCKDFQTEVLPSLASLSRHEVTEDLQIIGGLMETAGFPVETSLGRRNVGRCSRARRRSGNSFCHGVENKVCSLLKQQNNDSELAFRERCLKGWGKTNRRRRGPRIPASNPPPIFS